MKRLGWFLILAALNVSAQDVIINPPLDVNPEAGRVIAKGMSGETPNEAPIGAIVPAKIDPVDGQLKLEEKKISNTAAVVIEPRQVSAPELVEATTFYPLEKYLQFSFGYLNSKWEKVDPTLDNGSTLTDFRVVSDMNQHSQFGFAVEMLHDTSKESIPENIRALQYKLFFDHHRPFFADKLDWMVGLALSIGDYSIRKLSLNASGEEVYTKIKSGTIYGVIPSAGLRFYLGGRNSIDIGVEYHQYFSKPQSYIGGLAFVPRFSFVF